MAPIDAPARVGEVLSRIGGGSDSSAFGNIEGAVLDGSGRVFVSDAESHVVRVFDLEGRPLAAIGRRGEGPGEFETPWWLTFDADGRLWVSSLRPHRLTAFELVGTTVADVETVPVRYRGSMAGPPVVDADTLWIPVLPPGPPENFEWRLAFMRLGAGGQDLGLITVPRHPAEDSSRATGRLTLPRPGRDAVEIRGFEPFAARFAMALNPRGGYARGLTSRYRVEAHTRHGDVAFSISMPGAGPEITAAERDSALASLDDLRQRAGALNGSFEEPTVGARKPVIKAMWFDQQGRLWIERSRHASATSRLADVYDSSGNPSFEARWPLGINLGLGAARDSLAVGIATDVLGVQEVVLLRFRPDRAPPSS